MDRRITVVLYVVAMAAVIAGVDFMFFRNRFWERLIVNIGVVLVFGAFYGVHDCHGSGEVFSIATPLELIDFMPDALILPRADCVVTRCFLATSIAGGEHAWNRQWIF